MRLPRDCLFALLLAVFMAACATPAEPQVTEAAETPLIDWNGLAPPDRPNTWLAAPEGAFDGQRDQVAPVFPVAAAELAKAWRAVVEAQPRSRVLAVSDDGLRLEAEQRSSVFGFVDRISSRVVPLGDARSSLAVYSRATKGYWDFGVNKTRVRDWLAALEHRIEPK